MGQTSSKKTGARDSRDNSLITTENAQQDEKRSITSVASANGSGSRPSSQARGLEASRRPAPSSGYASQDVDNEDHLPSSIDKLSLDKSDSQADATVNQKGSSRPSLPALDVTSDRPTTPTQQPRNSPPIPTLSPDSAMRSNPTAAANAPVSPNMPTTQTILANPGGSSRLGSNSNGAPTDTLNLEDMIQRLLDAGYAGKVTKSVCLKNAEITAICNAAREVFLTQPTLVELSPSVKIVGDVHGQYTDLIRLFEMCGFPPSANYLFLGDYVDRGKQSLETVLLLMCYKIKYPENFFLLRGNHECANVTRVYGFYDECKRRCNIKIWKSFIDAFNCLPIAAIVAGKIFCVHGGLSPSLCDMDEIRRIARPTDVPDWGLLNDLLWSDPSDTAVEWEDNERGVSYCFGRSVINDFLSRYDFDLVCRAHMVVEDGYEFFNDRSLVTVFSAPNYCGEFNNWGAIMGVSEELLCSFELLKPLDGAALRKEMTRNRKKLSQHTHSSPPAGQVAQTY